MSNRKRLCRLAGLLTMSLLWTGCGREAQSVEVPELLEPVDMAVDMTYAERRDVYQVTTWESAVLPYLEELSFAATGELKEIKVFIGDEVHEGDVLAELKNTGNDSYTALLEKLQAMQESNQESNRLAEINIEIAKLSGQDTGRQELQLKQQKELQQLEEEHLLAEIENAEQELQSFQIIAPFDGKVVAITSLESGAAVAENTSVLVLAREDGNYYLNCDFISEKTAKESTRIYAVVRGEEYELTYLPYEQSELTAMSVQGKAPVANYLLEDGAEVEVGDYAIVCRVSDMRENVISVPYHAIYSESGQKYVYVIDGESRIKTPVVTGVYGAMYVEIVEGLEEGACVYVKN